MVNSDKSDLRDVLWKMYQEHVTQGRHHETQRSTVAAGLIAISSAILGIITFDKSVSAWDLPLALLLSAIGAFGIVFAAKHYERFGLHMERARAYRDELDALLPQSPLKRLKEEADVRSRVRVITRLRLNWLWYALNGLVLALGVFLSAMAAFWPTAPAP